MRHSPSRARPPCTLSLPRPAIFSAMLRASGVIQQIEVIKLEHVAAALASRQVGPPAWQSPTCPTWIETPHRSPACSCRPAEPSKSQRFSLRLASFVTVFETTAHRVISGFPQRGRVTDVAPICGQTRSRSWNMRDGRDSRRLTWCVERECAFTSARDGRAWLCGFGDEQ